MPNILPTTEWAAGSQLREPLMTATAEHGPQNQQHISQPGRKFRGHPTSGLVSGCAWSFNPLTGDFAYLPTRTVSFQEVAGFLNNIPRPLYIVLR